MRNFAKCDYQSLRVGHKSDRLDTTWTNQMRLHCGTFGVQGSSRCSKRLAPRTKPHILLWDLLWDLGGTKWDLRNVRNSACNCRLLKKYTLYDGPDALIANKLLQLG